MDAIWISLIVVAAIIVVMGVVIGLRRRRSGDYAEHLDARDRAQKPEDAQTVAAARYSDRSGSGAGGSF